MTLAADTTLNAPNVNLFSPVTGAGNNLVLNSPGLTLLDGNINGVNALVTDAPGSTVVNGTINAGSVSIHDPVILGGSGVTTSGDQSYFGAVTLAANSTLSGANVTLFSTLDGGAGNNVTINSPGATTVAGDISGVGALATDATGSTLLSGNIDAGSLSLGDSATLNGTLIHTSGSQTYGGAVSAGGTISAASLTANSSATLSTVTTSGGQTYNGPTTINGTIGASTLAMNSSSTLNGGTVTTAGDQTYGGIVTLGANTTMKTTAAGATMNFGQGVNGAGRTLTLSGSANIIQSGPLILGDLHFDTAGSVVLINLGNEITHAQADSSGWQATDSKGFMVSDSLSASLFVGRLAGSARSTEFNEPFTKIFAQLVPQMQVGNPEPAKVDLDADASGEFQGILTRSAELLTRSTEIFLEKKK